MTSPKYFLFFCDCLKTHVFFEFCWKVLGTFWGHFGNILGHFGTFFWDFFWTVLGIFGEHFGTIFGIKKTSFFELKHISVPEIFFNWYIFKSSLPCRKAILRCLRLEHRFQTWESGSDDEISRRIRISGPKYGNPASRGEKLGKRSSEKLLFN